jgi:hypothetical protein
MIAGQLTISWQIARVMWGDFSAGKSYYMRWRNR